MPAICCYMLLSGHYASYLLLYVDVRAQCLLSVVICYCQVTMPAICCYMLLSGHYASYLLLYVAVRSLCLLSVVIC